MHLSLLHHVGFLLLQSLSGPTSLTSDEESFDVDRNRSTVGNSSVAERPGFLSYRKRPCSICFSWTAPANGRSSWNQTPILCQFRIEPGYIPPPMPRRLRLNRAQQVWSLLQDNYYIWQQPQHAHTRRRAQSPISRYQQTLGTASPAAFKYLDTEWLVHFNTLINAFATTSAPAGLVWVWSSGNSVGYTAE